MVVVDAVVLSVVLELAVVEGVVLTVVVVVEAAVLSVVLELAVVEGAALGTNLAPSTPGLGPPYKISEARLQKPTSAIKLMPAQPSVVLQMSTQSL